MGWQAIAWSLGALSMAVALLASIAEPFLRKFDDRKGAYFFPLVQGFMSAAGLVAFALALVVDPVDGMTPMITIGAVATVVSGASVYLVLVMALGWFKAHRDKRRATN